MVYVATATEGLPVPATLTKPVRDSASYRRGPIFIELVLLEAAAVSMLISDQIQLLLHQYWWFWWLWHPQ
jgi:hypothetical protein